MSIGGIISLIFVAILFDTIFGMLFVFAFVEHNINITSPSNLYHTTEMNYPGCICTYIFLHFIWLPVYIVLDFFNLFHIGRNN